MFAFHQPANKRLLLAWGVLLLSVCVFTTGCHPLHTAAREGDVEHAEWLLKQGHDPNRMHFKTLATPLIEAAIAGHLDIVKLLVENGADVNRGGDTYQTSLHFAAANGHLKMVEYLLGQEAKSSKALHEAARTGELEVAQVLLDHKVDINEQGIDESTPLEIAVTYKQVDMAKFLLAQGAEVNSVGIYGRTPLHCAAWNDDLTIGRLLLEHGADPSLECNGRPVSGQSDAFRRLLEEFIRY